MPTREPSATTSVQPSEASEAEATAGERLPVAEEGRLPREPRRSRRPRTPLGQRRGGAKFQAATTAGILLAVLVIWAVGSETGIWSGAVLPPPGEAFGAVVDMVQTAVFWEALRITATEIVAVFVGALILGFLTGMLFWKVPYLGRMCEPYLVSFYAVPFIVFYPIMVVLIGLNSGPIILLATIMAIIPMILNTWIGLSEVPGVYWKLAASLECNRRQTIFRIAIPAAAPIIMAGVRLAMIYSLIGSVSMEFLLAPNGLGFQIRNQYELFEQAQMTGYVIVVFAIAGSLAITIALMENWVLGRRRST